MCAGLDEERIAAIEERIAVELDLGHHRELVGELTDLVAAMPTRERLVAQLMLALYRDGQAAKALEVGALAKAALADELGIDAGPEVRGMEIAILRQAPELDVPSSRVEVAPIVAPAQLPLDAAAFIGRQAELDALDSMLMPDAPAGSGHRSDRRDHRHRRRRQDRARRAMGTRRPRALPGRPAFHGHARVRRRHAHAVGGRAGPVPAGARRAR